MRELILFMLRGVLAPLFSKGETPFELIYFRRMS
jgi:hypothetical protein